LQSGFDPEADPGLAPLTRLPGIGSRLAERLGGLGLTRIWDLAWHLPLRWQDQTRIRALASLHEGTEAAFEGLIVATEVISGRRRMLRVRLTDASGSVTLRYFQPAPGLEQRLQPGARLRGFGPVRRVGALLEIAHPESQIAPPGTELPPPPTHLTPIYPAGRGRSQTTVRKAAGLALATLRPVTEQLPSWLAHGLEPGPTPRHLAEALDWLHHPPAGLTTEQQQQRQTQARRFLATDELLAHLAALRQARRGAKAATIGTTAAPSPVLQPGALSAQLLTTLPFALTPAQQRVLGEIEAELGRDTPMLRLLQGDVGSGKTIVAALAATAALDSNTQVAVMAPTELLAEQLYRNLDHWLAPLGVTPLWLAGSLGAAAKREAAEALASGAARLVVGTHALIQQPVRFARLGLVIIDEQHRFGVAQRLELTRKGERSGQLPHQLMLSATPIPRSLAMTLWGDLDLSVLDQRPPGRQPIRTAAIGLSRLEEVTARLKAALDTGRQAYWVCPAIAVDAEATAADAAASAAADSDEPAAAEARFHALCEALPGVPVGLVHGRLPARQKEATLRAFRDGAVRLLVATTVIAVGVDVPNASLMIIEEAERFGLAQLHQLRGRVGRGTVASSCALLHREPLGRNARARLQALRESEDGFALAELDLKLRGPGELLGKRQAGLPAWRVADAERDADLLAQLPALLDTLSPAQQQGLSRRWYGDTPWQHA